MSLRILLLSVLLASALGQIDQALKNVIRVRIRDYLSVPASTQSISIGNFELYHHDTHQPYQLVSTGVIVVTLRKVRYFVLYENHFLAKIIPWCGWVAIKHCQKTVSIAFDNQWKWIISWSKVGEYNSFIAECTPSNLSRNCYTSIHSNYQGWLYSNIILLNKPSLYYWIKNLFLNISLTHKKYRSNQLIIDFSLRAVKWPCRLEIWSI